ncbi:MAG: PHP domain-containing protein [Vicinamibacterales bacterium]
MTAPSTPRVPLGTAYDTLDTLGQIIGQQPGVAGSWPTGAVRRGVDVMEQVDLLVATNDPSPLLDAVSGADDLEVRRREPWLLEATLRRTPVRIECVPLEEAGIRQLERTAHPVHFERLAARAAARDLHLTRTGLAGADGSVLASTEEGVYAALGLPAFPPELRNGDGEFEAADEGRLPAVLERRDIRGDLHMHSLWSDGRDAIEAMVVTSIGLGYEYIAITDHSQSSRAIRNLTREGVERQADEIASLREQYPQIAILHGCEVDILEDGSLDFSDAVLERFDIVLASLHEAFDHDGGTLLRRYASAMRHPLVSVITHPTNRLVAFRDGYDLDYDRLFELAVATGTCLEIDGAPSHLDLDAGLARRAVQAGVLLTVDSDCHRAVALDRQMHLGVVIARRGWVGAAQVLNTRPLADVQAHVAAKRGGRRPRT